MRRVLELVRVRVLKTDGLSMHGKVQEKKAISDVE